MSPTTVILGLQEGAPVSYFIAGPDYIGPKPTPIVKKISKGLRTALSEYNDQFTQGMLFWTPYSNELRAVYSTYGNPSVSAGFKPYANSAFHVYQIQQEYSIPTPRWKYETLNGEERDPIAMALSALSLGSTGLAAQGSSYSDLASAASQGFSFLQKLAPLAGKVGVRSIPYLGWASTILDILGKLLGALEDGDAPDLVPQPEGGGDTVDVYTLPGESLPASFSIPDSPSYNGQNFDFSEKYGTFPSAARTIQHIYDLFSKELYLYIECKLDLEPYTKASWQMLHMARALGIVRYFRKYFNQFGIYLEFQFDFAEWLTTDPEDFDGFNDFFLFLREYLENLISVIYRAQADSPDIFRIIDECGCERKIVFPDGGISISVAMPALSEYFAGRTHVNLEESIESSGDCVFPYSIVNGYQIIPTI